MTETQNKAQKGLFKDLIQLFVTFFKIGSITFGGGYAILPILQKELADKRHWTTEDDLLDYYAIAQVTPGIIAVNVATFIGYKRRGVLGGIFSTLGVITPSIIIISLIATFISNFEDIVWVQKALRGINVAVAALLTYSVFNLTKKTIKKWYYIFFYAAAFASVYFLHVSSVVVTVSAIVAGILFSVLNGSLRRDGKKSDREGENK